MKILFIVVFLVISLLFNGCASMKDRWHKAESIDTVKSYQEYLSRYPNSIYAAEAQDRILEFHWKEATLANTKRAYKNFLRNHGKSRYSDEAKKRIKLIEENLAYNKIIKSNSVQDLRKFLSDYPNSKKHNSIITIIKKIEDDLYLAAINSGIKKSLDNYIQKFPNGRYYNQIMNKLNSFSWIFLSSPEILKWNQIDMPEPLNSKELNNHIEEKSYGFQIKGFAAGPGGVLVMFNNLIYCKELAEVDDMGKILPTNVIISNIDDVDGGAVSFKIKEGFTLPTVGFAMIIAVGSEMLIEKQELPVNFYGHSIKQGKIKVDPEGLELQPGTEILMAK